MTPSPELPSLAVAAPVTEGEAAADRSEVLQAFCLMNHEGSGGPGAVATCVVVATGLARSCPATTSVVSCHTLEPLPATPLHTTSPTSSATASTEGAAGGQNDLAG